MFDYIKGILVNKNFPYCTIENNGIGYLLYVNNRTLAELSEIGCEIKIYTKLIHKEDNMFYCGFKKREDRVIFDILTSVSGIGVKAAFTLLDEFETSELVSAVINEDYKLISKTKGIGLKTAQKIVLELRDKLIKTDITNEIIVSKAQSSQSEISKSTIAQATAVLESLGYNKNEYEDVLVETLNKIKKDDPEELLKEVLKVLSVF